eukprot:TRINITY_DN274_c0_g3_i5.p1 TRINITY_DN274_c0_g3~~TRINITY_DN274_c0_g3_i5.p1  ORF type:complete len:127 (-),score=3.44 TRINITY_DN274_c0_g3_i5:309-689(-)
MHESVMMRRRVEEDGLRVVNSCQQGRNVALLIVEQLDGTCRGSHGQLCASSRGNTEVANVVRIYWAQRVRRRFCMSDVKAHLSWVELHSKLQNQSTEEENGIHGVAVKCVDIKWNTGGEGASLDKY